MFKLWLEKIEIFPIMTYVPGIWCKTILTLKKYLRNAPYRYLAFEYLRHWKRKKLCTVPVVKYFLRIANAVPVFFAIGRFSICEQFSLRPEVCPSLDPFPSLFKECWRQKKLFWRNYYVKILFLYIKKWWHVKKVLNLCESV